MRGHVVTYHSNYYTVQTERPDGTSCRYECLLKGLLKKAGDTVLVGDWVQLDSIDEVMGSARIVQIEARRSELSRPKIANVDQVMVIVPWQQPAFDSRQLSRLLTHIHLAKLPVHIVISKADLPGAVPDYTTLDEALETYQSLGYSCVASSIHKPNSLPAVFALLEGKTTVLAGVSGAGKSSLMNALQPGLQLRVGDVSGKLERGQHTTRHVELLALKAPNTAGTRSEKPTYLADSPGFSHLKLETIRPIDVRNTFPEFKDAACGFADCLHRDEQDCSVLPNLAQYIRPDRYDAYQELLTEAEATYREEQALSVKQDSARKTVGNSERVRLHGRHREASRRQSKQQLRPHEVDLHDPEGEETLW